MKVRFPKTLGKRILSIWLLALILNLLYTVVIDSFQPSKKPVSRTYDLGDSDAACSNLRMNLNQDRVFLDQKHQEDYQSILRSTKNDEAFADAVTDYPELLTPQLNRADWSEHALRMRDAFWKSAKIAGLDSNLGVILQNAGETWNERRIAYNTPPGPLKGKLMTEQIELDTRLSADTSKIRNECNISIQILP